MRHSPSLVIHTVMVMVVGTRVSWSENEGEVEHDGEHGDASESGGKHEAIYVDKAGHKVEIESEDGGTQNFLQSHRPSSH